MRPSHLTPRDPNLTHQVVFVRSDNQIHVSCNCRIVKDPVHGVSKHESMGTSIELRLSRVIYNNPANHSKPFGKEDEAKW